MSAATRLKSGRVESSGCARAGGGSHARGVRRVSLRFAGYRSLHVINEVILHESTRPERFGSLIMVISAASPLLGLLGTVIGMITTFQVITLFGSGDPTLLAGGIAIALVNTELGLTVAIPSLLIGSVLTAWASRIKDDMLKATLRVTNLYEDYEIAARRKAV